MDKNLSNPASVLALSGYARKLGIRHIETSPDRAVYALPFSADNVTVADVVHGGAILSLADIAATGAAWSVIGDASRYQGLTIDLSHAFMSAARSADLTAEAKVLKRGSTVCFVEVDIRNSTSGEAIARTKVVYKLSKLDSATETVTKLFRDKSVADQQALLAVLEQAGAAMYRQWAEAETDPKYRQALLDGAQRELANAETLRNR
jgi:uncharacterized protein (TIGR00369 family)